MAGFLSAWDKIQSFNMAGKAEVEICLEGEDKLEKRKHCMKNPGHEKFIPINDFTVKHLPKYFNNKWVLNYVKVAADLTVRVNASYVSALRPDHYVLHSARGKNCLHFGSGWILAISNRYSAKDEKVCPCEKCKKSRRPEVEWGQVKMVTAQHVVFNEEEAGRTQCELFYDSEEVKIQDCAKLTGMGVKYKCMNSDYIEILCATHDINLLNMLEEKIQMRRYLERIVQNKYRDRTELGELAIVISHPHACCKHVSIGAVTDKESEEPYKRFYSAATCDGSSGGYVWLPRDRRMREEKSFVRHTHHSGGESNSSNDRNYSGTWGF